MKRENIRTKTDEVRIYISPIMFAMALYFTATGMAYEFVCSLAAVILHECAHARVARRIGYELNVLKLMPYGAAICGEVDMRPSHEVKIAAAGPLFNLTAAALLAALWWLVPNSYMYTQEFCFANLYIGAFNMLPVYPLDGGRVAFALLSARFGRKNAYKAVRVISAVLGVVSLALFALSAVYSLNLCLLSVGLFMLVSALVPDGKARYGKLFAAESLRNRIKNPIEVKRYAVGENTTLGEMIGLLDPDRYSEFEIINDVSLQIVGKMSESALIAAVKSDGYGATAGEVMKSIEDSESKIRKQ